MSTKIYDKIINKNDPVQNALALEYFLLNGKDNLRDDAYYRNLQDKIKAKDDKGSFFSNSYTLESLKIARDMAKLSTKSFCEYIYDVEKYKHEKEKKVKTEERSR